MRKIRWKDEGRQEEGTKKQREGDEVGGGRESGKGRSLGQEKSREAGSVRRKDQR